ncbi:MAG: M20/M25/M40 family metallo-hydrolase [Peptococcaceae bacterium]|nr:M20/M25/M40 family metallo-hydrolase [Peptococcaceae bacterium]
MSFVVDEFIKLTSINSPPKKEGVLGRYLVEQLTRLGCAVTIDDSAQATGSDMGNIIARHPGCSGSLGSSGAEGAAQVPVLLLSAHMDTVTATEGMTPQRCGDRLVSNGETVLGADDKAGIAMILGLLEVVQRDAALSCPPLEIVLTVQEEVGLVGCRGLTEPLQGAYGYVLDGDGDVGSVVNRAPTHTVMTLKVRGRAAHAGAEPEKGINAIVVAAEAIAQIRSGRIDLETTSNFGTIHGGKAMNIVAEDVEITAEVRSLSPQRMEAEVQRILDVFERACAEKGAGLQVEKEVHYQAYSLADDHPLICMAREAAQATGEAFVLEATGAGSDANIFNERGVPCTVLGIGMTEPHTIVESIAVDQLEKGVALLVEIVKRAARQKA